MLVGNQSAPVGRSAGGLDLRGERGGGLLFALAALPASSAGCFRGPVSLLPTLNAVLNGLCTVCLLTGFYFIRRRNIPAHRAAMMTAFVFSSLFLVSYILNHALHGDTIFPGHGTVKTVYLGILISHIGLSIVALPMVLTTFFFFRSAGAFGNIARLRVSRCLSGSTSRSPGWWCTPCWLRGGRRCSSRGAGAPPGEADAG